MMCRLYNGSKAFIKGEVDAGLGEVGVDILTSVETRDCQISVGNKCASRRVQMVQEWWICPKQQLLHQTLH